MFATSLRRFALIAAIVASAAFPHAAAAQSSENPAVGVEDPAAVVDNSATAPSPAAAPPQIGYPDYMVNEMYLRQLQGVRSGWSTLEYHIDDMARQQRLGTYDPGIGQIIVSQYPPVVDRLEALLTGLTPPSRFAHIQQLHMGAAAEFRIAMDSAVRWLSSGNRTALLDAQGHFDRFDWLIGQAVLELN